MLIPLTLLLYYISCSFFLPDNCFADSHLHNVDNFVVAVEDVESVTQKIESSCRWINLNRLFHQIDLQVASLIQNLNHHFVDHFRVLNYYWEQLRGLLSLRSYLIIFSLRVELPLNLLHCQDPCSIFLLN